MMKTFSTRALLGFTLVEAMVSIAILSIALLGPFYAAQQSLTASATAKNQLTASMLAQEAIEMVRGVRDNNFLYQSANPGSGQSWMYGLDGSGNSTNCYSPNKCTLDVPNQTVTTCTGGSCTAPLYINANYQYVQTPTGTPTTYVRSISISTVSATEVKVIATVTWTYHNVAFSTNVTEYLDNWQ